MADLMNSVISGLRDGSLYGLLAVGIVLIYKATGVLSFALANIGMVATMILYSLTSTGLPYVADIALCLACAVALGLGLERLFVRPVLRAPALTSMMVTLAISTLLGALATQIWQGSTAASLAPPFDVNSRELGHSGVYLAPLDVATGLVSLAIAAGLYAFFRWTWLGLAMRATADRMETAPLMGIRPGQISATAWGLGSLVAAVSGIFQASNLTALDTSFMLGSLVWAMAAAALGSMTSLPGALVAGLLIGVLNQVLQLPFGPIDISVFHQSAVFGLVILVLMVRRQGLFSGPEMRRV
jgi:branched-chain amino acid transport system permease protein